MESKNLNVHITNYTLQKHTQDFNKFEIGNEIPFNEFQRFLDSNNISIDIKKDIYPKMKEIIKLSILSVF